MWQLMTDDASERHMTNSHPCLDTKTSLTIGPLPLAAPSSLPPMTTNAGILSTRLQTGEFVSVQLWRDTLQTAIFPSRSMSWVV